jgi:RNA polymerase sigma-70 factor (ECF subfamily)
VTRSVDDTIRQEGGQVLATHIRLTGDFTIAEDALQDASIVALDRWERDGVPRNPAAWLTRVARNKALDHMRRESRRADREREAMRLLANPDEGIEPTDPLRLVFTCCHPALAPEARIALTLRTISQLTTREIARAFLEPEPTVAQRISRAKRKIQVAGIPYRIPDDSELPDRLPAVLQVLYVTFTAGYAAFDGAADSRVELGNEAIRLTRMLAQLMPDEPEVRGLLALMLATWARRTTRIDDHGDLVLLEDQDRGMWDRGSIDEAIAILDAHPVGTHGWYAIQASIAVLHSSAPTFADTDWGRIADLYVELEAINPSPVVRVNHAVAVAHATGPVDGLALLDAVDGLPGMRAWHLYWSTRAELLRRLGRTTESADCLRQALECPMNDADRRLLTARLMAMKES